MRRTFPPLPELGGLEKKHKSDTPWDRYRVLDWYHTARICCGLFFAAYVVERKLSKYRREIWHRGDRRGSSPEAANNAPAKGPLSRS